MDSIAIFYSVPPVPERRYTSGNEDVPKFAHSLIAQTRNSLAFSMSTPCRSNLLHRPGRMGKSTTFLTCLGSVGGIEAALGHFLRVQRATVTKRNAVYYLKHLEFTDQSTTSGHDNAGLHVVQPFSYRKPDESGFVARGNPKARRSGNARHASH
jgi:hypothetical protein